MKRYVSILLALILLLGCTAGCGSAELTAQEAGAIIKDVNDRYGKIFKYLHSPIYAMKVNRSRTLSDDPDMCLVTDEQFPDLQAVRDFLGAVVTDAFIDKQSPIIFNEDYISPQEVELRGFDALDCATLYYEYEGRLYANQNPPMDSVDLRETDWNDPKIVTRSATKIVVKYPLVFPHYLDNDTIYYAPDGSITYTVVKENDTWLLDDITKKDKDSAVPHGDVSAADLTNKQAADILAVLVPRQQQIELLFSGEGGVDEMVTCPIDSNYRRSTDVRFSCVQDIKDYISGVVTADEAQGYFDRYLGEVQDSSSGTPEYIDYDGKLYRNVASGGKGFATTYLIKSSRIVERTKDTVKIEMDTLLFGEPHSRIYTPTLVKTADGWRVDNDMYKGYESDNPTSEAANREQEDVNEIFRSLLLKSVELNIAVADELAWDFGGDVPLLEEGSIITSGGRTYTLEVDYGKLQDPTRLHALGIYSLADLRTKTEEIYTAACAEKTRYYTLPDDAASANSPACVEYEGALYRQGVSWLIVDRYVLETIRLTEKTDTTATFEISCIDWQGNLSEKPLSFLMVKTAQGWRLDNCYIYVTCSL